jgi:hypothetical protein
MFKVYKKDDRGRAYTVYDTKSVVISDKSKSMTEFLMYIDNQWQWVYANDYVPAID